MFLLPPSGGLELTRERSVTLGILMFTLTNTILCSLLFLLLLQAPLSRLTQS